MKIVRQVAFLLSFMIMMGHELIPHTHACEDCLTESSAVIPPISSGLADIQNAYAHFQHGSAERHLTYLGTTEKKDNSQLKIHFPLAFDTSVEYSLTWFANFKKQRFWENTVFFFSHELNSFSLRGPPFC